MRKGIWIIILLLTIGFTQAYCQRTATSQRVTASTKVSKDLMKANKETIKNLKKQNKLNKVEIEVAKDGNWYFLLTNKDKYQGIRYGIADKQGKIIVPIQYQHLAYYPATEEGYSDIPCYNSSDLQTQAVSGYFKMYTKACKGSFLARASTIDIYSISGERLQHYKTSSVSFLPGYFVIGTNNKITGSAGMYKDYSYKNLIIGGTNLAFVTTDGVELESGVEAFSFKEKVQGCVYSKTDSTGVQRAGAFVLNDPSFRIPCLFHTADFNEYMGRWCVRRNANSENEIFDPCKNYSVQYRDKGEEYFEKKYYDSVINFYAEEGVSAPWAKFFTAASLYHKALEHKTTVSLICRLIEGNSERMYDMFKDENFDLVLAADMCKTGVQLLESYLKEDALYTQNAKMYLSWHKNLIKEAPELQIRYNNALKLLEQRKQEAYLTQLRKQQEAEQRQAQIMSAILNGFLNAIVGGGSSSNGNTNSSSSISRQQSYASPSSSKSVDTSKLADWRNRKANAEKLLEKYSEQLRKEPNSAALKHNIRCQEDIIKTCNERIAEIQSGK